MSLVSKLSDERSDVISLRSACIWKSSSKNKKRSRFDEKRCKSDVFRTAGAKQCACAFVPSRVEK